MLPSSMYTVEMTMLPSSVCSKKNMYKIAHKKHGCLLTRFTKLLIKLNDVIIKLYGPLFEDTGADNTPETKNYCGVR